MHETIRSRGRPSALMLSCEPSMPGYPSMKMQYCSYELGCGMSTTQSRCVQKSRLFCCFPVIPKPSDLFMTAANTFTAGQMIPRSISCFRGGCHAQACLQAETAAKVSRPPQPVHGPPSRTQPGDWRPREQSDRTRYPATAALSSSLCASPPTTPDRQNQSSPSQGPNQASNERRTTPRSSPAATPFNNHESRVVSAFM